MAINFHHSSAFAFHDSLLLASRLPITIQAAKNTPDPTKLMIETSFANAAHRLKIKIIIAIVFFILAPYLEFIK
jgi:hypothetical protein